MAKIKLFNMFSYLWFNFYLIIWKQLLNNQLTVKKKNTSVDKKPQIQFLLSKVSVFIVQFGQHLLKCSAKVLHRLKANNQSYP